MRAGEPEAQPEKESKKGEKRCKENQKEEMCKNTIYSDTRKHASNIWGRNT